MKSVFSFRTPHPKMPPLFTDTEDIGYTTRTLELEKPNITRPCFLFILFTLMPVPL